jgi:serine/threonine protein kinase
VSMPVHQPGLAALRNPVAGMDVGNEKKASGAQVQDMNGKSTAENTPNAPANRNGSRNRILGDYTLSKTLGAGSMGKVKLAHHNVTGEKVSTSIGIEN